MTMRIGVVVAQFPVPSETFIVTKVLGLLDQGFDVHIFVSKTSRHWGQFAVLNQRDDVQRKIHTAPPHSSPLDLLIGLPSVLFTLLRHPAAFVRFVRHNWRKRKTLPMGFLKGIYLRLHFVGHHIDVLHIEFDSQALGTADLKDYFGCKLLLSARGTFQKQTVLDEFPNAPNYIYGYANAYHVISNYLRENTLRLGFDPAKPYWLIQPAVDLTLFAPRSFPEPADRPLRLITVARLMWQKGYEFAIDAVAIAHEAGLSIQYMIVGDGTYKDAIVYAARQRNLLDNGVIQFVGAVPREQVVRYLNEADVMIHASVDEGFCNAVIEAQAVGVPVIASDAGGLPENLEDGVTGFIVPRRNPQAMAAKIIELANHPDLRQQMGMAGQRRARERFNLQSQVEAFAALYRELGDARD